MSEPISPGKPARLLGAAALVAVSVLAQTGPVAHAVPGPVPAIAAPVSAAPQILSAESKQPAAGAAVGTLATGPALEIPIERTPIVWEPPPAPVEDHSQYGDASWYGPGFHGRTAASGETFDATARTVAHRTLPLGTVVQIENLDTGRSVIARVNDRGPFVDGRIVDCSWAVARELGFIGSGVVPVRLTVLDSIAPAADFEGAMYAAAELPWEDPAPAVPELETQPGIDVAAAPAGAASTPADDDFETVRQASVLPFPAIVHASHHVYDWVVAHRSWFRVPEGVRTQVRSISLRAFARLFSF